jgi:hypothetical protein
MQSSASPNQPLRNKFLLFCCDDEQSLTLGEYDGLDAHSSAFALAIQFL